MKIGLVIYASLINRITDFYSTAFGFESVESDSSYTVLGNSEFELVFLETEISKNFRSSNEPREATPIKPTFFIESSLEFATKKITAKGGAVYPLKNWEFFGRRVCDACDCEGNIFQLRISRNS